MPERRRFFDTDRADSREHLILFAMAKMKREQDTATFHFSNVNPKGRKTGDCVVRAISAFLGESWEQVYRELAELGIKRGTAMDCPETYVKFLETRGFVKCPMPRHADGTRFTGREYCERLAVGGWVYILSMAGHLTFVNADGRIWDIWDCGEKSVGNVWKRELK